MARQVNGIRKTINMLKIAPPLAMGDDGLRKHIIRALGRNLGINHTKITVRVVDGVVHLGGTVNITAEKHLAEREVRVVHGVTDIINKIQVITAKPKKNTEIVGEILYGLSHCLGLDLSTISVEFRHGVAYLQGKVPSDYFKDAAEELVRMTPLVTGVVNKLETRHWLGSEVLSGTP